MQLEHFIKKKMLQSYKDQNKLTQERFGDEMFCLQDAASEDLFLPMFHSKPSILQLLQLINF